MLHPSFSTAMVFTPKNLQASPLPPTTLFQMCYYFSSEVHPFAMTVVGQNQSSVDLH